MLKLLVSCYMIFVYRNITTFNTHTCITQYVSKILSSIDSLKLLVNHEHFQLSESSLGIWSSSYIDEIKSSFVSVSAHVFSLLNNKWYFDNDWLAEYHMMENVWCQLEKISARKKWKSFSSNIGKREIALTNKTVTLTEKNGYICFGYIYDNIHAWICIKVWNSNFKLKLPNGSPI